MIADKYTDKRTVRFDLGPEIPEHRTAKGNRPLRLRWMEIKYSVTKPSGRAHIWVELCGDKIEPDTKWGQSRGGDFTKRTFGSPWGRDCPDDAVPTFDELGLPEWARPYVEANRPPWFPGGAQ